MSEDEATYEQCVFTTAAGTRCQRDVRNPPYPYGQYVGWIAICSHHRSQIERYLVIQRRIDRGGHA